MKYINFIGRNKLRFNRGYTYIVAFGIPFLIVDALERRFTEIPFSYAFILAILLVWITGYLDDKMGLLSAEQSFAISKNEGLINLIKEKK